MNRTDRNSTLMIAGVLGWFSVMMITRVRAEFAYADTLYLTGFGMFLAGFLAINFIATAMQDKRIALACMLVQLVGFSLVFVCCQSTDALILLVIFAGQLPFFLTKPQAIAVLLTINGICLLLYHLVWHRELHPSLIAVALNLAFQSFALAVAHIAVKESEAREALEQVNAELVSTRSLLEQTSRQAERLKLSRDLHDICGHQLTALLLNLEFLSKTVPAPQQQGVDETKQIARDLLNKIRDVVRQNKQSAQLDLNAAIDSLFAHLPQVHCDFTERLPAPLMSGHHAEVLLRICQEAVSNALRYGSEKRVTISLVQHAAEVVLTVKNAVAVKKPKREGSGLHNMQERAAQLGGTVSITADDREWQVRAALPYKEQSYD